MLAWLRRLFAEPAEQVHQDPVLGELRRRGDSDWEGVRAFPGPEDEILLFVPAPPGSGPPASAGVCWQEIEARYAALKPELEGALKGYAELPEGTTFELGSISLDSPGTFEAQFTPNPEDGDMGYFVVVRNWVIEGVSGAD